MGVDCLADLDREVSGDRLVDLNDDQRAIGLGS
jgi:hypothetical protein